MLIKRKFGSHVSHRCFLIHTLRILKVRIKTLSLAFSLLALTHSSLSKGTERREKVEISQAGVEMSIWITWHTCVLGCFFHLSNDLFAAQINCYFNTRGICLPF